MDAPASSRIDTPAVMTAERYTVALVYVKPVELHAITAMLDEEFESIRPHESDLNEYILGRIGRHLVVIAGPPRGEQGKVAIASVVSKVRASFSGVRFALLVGIGGGVPHLPKHDVRLGDVVVGAPEYGPAVVQYDLGKQTDDDIHVTRTLNKPSKTLLTVVNIVEDKMLRRRQGQSSFFQEHLRRFEQFPRLRRDYSHPGSQDRLFHAEFSHQNGDCATHDRRFEVPRHPREAGEEIQVHYGTILSGDSVMKSAKRRDLISNRYYEALCFEMEAAGLVEEIPTLVVRGICDYADTHKNKEWQSFASATAASYAREVLLIASPRQVIDADSLENKLATGCASERPLNTQSAEEQRRAVEIEETFRSLDFKERFVRQQQLASLQTIDQSFAWLWTSDFTTWLRSETDGDDIFWVNGKPASGKSTMMNHIASSPQTQQYLRSSIDDHWHIIGFFFDFRAGETIANSFEGLLRALLVQLVEKIPRLLKDMPLYQALFRKVSETNGLLPNPVQRQNPDVSTADLMREILSAIDQSRQPLLVLLDGLDEYEGNKFELVDFIRELNKNGLVKVCLASRPEPPFPDAFRCAPSLRMHERNYEGIEVFIQHQFTNIFSRRSEGEQQFLDTLISQIARRAEGVFLWARFATFEVLEGLGQGESPESSYLLGRLEKVPRELTEIYRRIFQRASESMRQRAALFLILICFSRETLVIDTLQEAVKMISETDLFPQFSAHAFEGWGAYGTSLGSFERFVLAATGGTVDTYEARVRWPVLKGFQYPSVVVLIRVAHRTLLTFLDTEGWALLLGDGMSAPELGHELWLRSCVRKLSTKSAEMRAIWHARSMTIDKSTLWYPSSVYAFEADGSETEVPELDSSICILNNTVRSRDQQVIIYAATHMLEHARCFEIYSNKSSYSLIRPDDMTEYMQLHVKCLGGCYCDLIMPPTIIGLAICHELQNCVAEYMEGSTAVVPSLCEISAANGPHQTVNEVNHTHLKDIAIMSACISTLLERLETKNVNLVLRLAILETISEYESAITDNQLIAAISSGGPQLLRLLLRDRPLPSRLKWSSDEDFDHFVRATLPPGSESLEHNASYGPLYLLPRCLRHTIMFIEESLEAKIDLLLNEGEQDINGQCGPNGCGTVCHGAIDRLPYLFGRLFVDYVNLLVKYGFNINERARKDELPGQTPRSRRRSLMQNTNGLEFAWMRLHKYLQHKSSCKDSPPSVLSMSRFQQAIQHLIDLGGVVEKVDPNGLVPDKARLLGFCEKVFDETNDYEVDVYTSELVRYYLEGPRKKDSGDDGGLASEPEDVVGFMSSDKSSSGPEDEIDEEDDQCHKSEHANEETNGSDREDEHGLSPPPPPPPPPPHLEDLHDHTGRLESELSLFD